MSCSFLHTPSQARQEPADYISIRDEFTKIFLREFNFIELHSSIDGRVVWRCCHDQSQKATEDMLSVVTSQHQEEEHQRTGHQTTPR